MSQIENYIADLENVEDLYHQNWVLPYGSAYSLAHERFRSTLDDQQKYDQAKRDLFITAVTLGFGAGMGAMFGKTAFRTVVADRALNFVCNRNMERTFALMHRVSSSVPGTYLVEGVWDAVQSQIGDQAKQLVTGLFATPGATANGVNNPQVLQNDMLAYVLRVKTTAHAVAADLRDNRSLSQADKDARASALRGADFFRNCPKRDLVGNRQTAANIMELSFYMVMVMNSDYLVEHRSGVRGAHEVDSRRRLGAITVPTSDPTYGAEQGMRHSYGPGYSITTSVYIDYDDLGSRVLDRTNTLYREFFSHDFISNRWYESGDTTHAALQRAERALGELNRRVHTMRPH
jgi:hypothetical protein